MRTVAIVGPGRIGQAMGRLLAESRVPIAFIAARNSAAARRAAQFIGKGKPIGLADPRLCEASVILITTSDSAVAEVARELARQGTGKRAWQGKVVLHTCGSLPSNVLRPLKLRGAAIGSVHPYQTVPSPKAGARNLRNCFWALEGDRAALLVARDWVRRLGGVAFVGSARAENALPSFRFHRVSDPGYTDGAGGRFTEAGGGASTGRAADAHAICSGDC